MHGVADPPFKGEVITEFQFLQIVVLSEAFAEFTEVPEELKGGGGGGVGSNFALCDLPVSVAARGFGDMGIVF